MSTKNPALTPFTFKDTGRTVLTRRVSPYMVFELQRAFPPPAPPMQEVDYGDGKTRLEPNSANPDYIESVKKYNLDFQEKMQRLIIKRGIHVNLSDDDREEVAELRKFWMDEFEKELDPDDRMVFILHICIGSDTDLEEILNAITRRSQPTEPAIKEALDGFRG
jgi:hypothetical protein